MRARSPGSRTWAPAKTRCLRADACARLPGRKAVIVSSSSATPPPKARGSALRCTRRVAAGFRLACSASSLSSGQRQRLSPLTTSTRSAGSRKAPSGGRAPAVPRSSGSSDQTRGMPRKRSPNWSRIWLPRWWRLMATASQPAARRRSSVQARSGRPDNRQQRLGERRGQRAQTLAAAGGEDERAQAGAGHVVRVTECGDAERASRRAARGCRGRSCRAARPDARRCSPRRASGSSCSATWSDRSRSASRPLRP